MPIWADILIIFAVVGIAYLAVARLRKHLLKLWKEVSSKEVIFYKQLEKVVTLFYVQSQLLKTEDNQEFFRVISRYRKKHFRTLLLKTRQDLFNAINIVYNEIEEMEDSELKVLKTEFNNLQKARRVYNSRVLIYNQTISVFPTRYLALRMNLELKEYFG